MYTREGFPRIQRIVHTLRNITYHIVLKRQSKRMCPILQESLYELVFVKFIYIVVPIQVDKNAR